MNKQQYGDEKVDNWFRHKGVEPPERIPHLTDDERDQLLKDNIAGHKCNKKSWTQNGAELTCDTGDGIVHGKRIGPNLRMKTDQNGDVILDDKGIPQLVPIGPILRKTVKQ